MHVCVLEDLKTDNYITPRIGFELLRKESRQ